MPARPAKRLVLVLDHVDETRQMVEEGLADEFVMYAAATADEARTILAQHRIGAMLLDVDLPDTKGLDLIQESLAVDPDLTIVIVTEADDPTIERLGLQRGAIDYLIRPLDLAEVRKSIRKGFVQRDARVEDRKLQRWLTDELTKLRWEAQQAREQSERLSLETLDALVTALEAKDPWAIGHSVRVAEVAVTVAGQLGFSEEEIEQVRTAGRLHDLGNIGVREEVLTHKGALTEEQLEHVKRHVMIGVQILERIEPLHDVIPIIRGHHERWDGDGYPDGLEADAIPKGARVLAAAEVFTALTSPRPYQETKTDLDALTTIGSMAGTVLDPAAADALIEVVKRKQAIDFIVDDRGRRSTS